MQVVGVHPRALIGRDGWYFEWKRDQKYAGRSCRIVGLSSTPGLVNVLVYNDPTLDCFNRSMRETQHALDVPMLAECPKDGDKKAFDQGCVLLNASGKPKG